MSRLINVSDDVYAELTTLKKAKGQSYSEAINELLDRNEDTKKTIGWEEIMEKIRKRETKFNGKTEKIDYDLVAYGVSRDAGTVKKKK